MKRDAMPWIMNLWTPSVVAAVIATMISGLASGQGRGADTIVRVVGAARFAGVAELTEELSIGTADGPSEYAFTDIAEVALGPDGSIFIIDRPGQGTPFVRQYDANGKLIRAIGRAGQGPGEYGAPSGLGVLRDGRVVLRDGANHRVNVYSASGEPAASWRLNETGVSTGSGMLLVDTSGTVWVRIQPPRMQPGAARPRAISMMRVRPDGSVIDTVALPELPPVGPPPLVATRSTPTATASSSLGVPYSPSTWVALSPLGYFVTAASTRYAIEIRQPREAGVGSLWRTGDAVISVRRERVGEVPIAEAERAARRAEIEERLRRTDPEWRWSGPDIPRVKQAFQGLRVAADGRIWVTTSQPSERFDPAAEPSAPVSTGVGGGGGSGPPPGARPVLPPPAPWRAPFIYDVFDPDGAYIGQVRVPYGVTLQVMSGDRVWGSIRDEDGVPYLKRYRIAWR